MCLDPSAVGLARTLRVAVDDFLRGVVETRMPRLLLRSLTPEGCINANGADHGHRHARGSFSSGDCSRSGRFDRNDARVRPRYRRSIQRPRVLPRHHRYEFGDQRDLGQAAGSKCPDPRPVDRTDRPAEGTKGAPEGRRCARPPWGRQHDRSRGMRSCCSPALAARGYRVGGLLICRADSGGVSLAPTSMLLARCVTWLSHQRRRDHEGAGGWQDPDVHMELMAGVGPQLLSSWWVAGSCTRLRLPPLSRGYRVRPTNRTPSSHAHGYQT